MADTHQELQNAIQAMNKILAIRVAQKRHGEIVSKHIVEQIVESSDVAEMVQFIETSIAREKEKRLPPHHGADHSLAADFTEEPKRNRPSMSGDSIRPAKALPLDLSDLQQKIQQKKKESVEHLSTDDSVGQTRAQETDTEKPVPHSADIDSVAEQSSVDNSESNKNPEMRSSSTEVLAAGVKDAGAEEKNTQFRDLTITAASSGEVKTEPLPKEEVSTNPPELDTNDDLSSSNELVDDSKSPVRLLVLCVVLIALLGVFVTLNLTEIKALILQWFSSLEHLIANL